jgi:hypothetical protein
VVGAVGVHRGGGEGGRRDLRSSAVEVSTMARGLRRQGEVAEKPVCTCGGEGEETGEEPSAQCGRWPFKGG